MSQQFFVSDIQSGSDFFDRQRREIPNLLSMLVGLVQEEDVFSYGVAKQVKIPTCPERNEPFWVIHLYFSFPGSAECRISRIDFGNCAVWMRDLDTRIWSGMTKVEVIRIYDNLQKLVDGMVEAFPLLKRDLGPFMTAAERMKR